MNTHTNRPLSTPDDLIQRIADDPSASNWLKEAIQSLLKRDALDAVKDAELLASIFQARLSYIESQFPSIRH